MKNILSKIIIKSAILCLLGFISAPVYSSVDIGLSGSYLDTGKEGALYGAGVFFSSGIESRYIPDNLYFILSASYLAGRENPGEMDEIVRVYAPVAAGIEYLYPLYSLPLQLKFSGGAGEGYFRKEEPARYGAFVDYSKTMSNSDTAPFLFFNAGLNYTVNQRLSVFADAGYHYSFMNADWLSEPVAGIQINAGVTIAVTGLNRDLDH